MQKTALFMSLLALGTACLFLFQNCGGPDAATAQSGKVAEPTDNGNNGQNTPPITDPNNGQMTGNIMDRGITLDNAIGPGELLTAGYSFQIGVDIAHYETDYRATTKTTYVKVISDGVGYSLVVDSDACVGQTAITADEAFAAYSFINGVIFNLRAVPATKSNCALPKVSLNAVNPVNRDVLIYLPLDVTCVPENTWYLDPSNTVNPPGLVQSIHTFYNGKIDQVCAANP